ncbi:unknown [Prevotella sp. CAG:5226]|nr:unknown [Prevotella sp. CAG:5226]
MHAVCTCLHSSARCMHLSAPLITNLCTWVDDGYTTYIIRYRGNGFLIRATEKSISRYCSNRLTQALRHNAVAEENRRKISVQTSVGKCRQVQTAVQIKNEVVYTT